MEGTNYLEIANSLAMWSAAGLAVAVVLVQALIFSKKSYSTGLEMGLPRADEGAIKSSVITAFGPFSAGYLISLDKNTVSCISGGVIMLVLNMIADKRALKWVREWSLFFALFGGMLALRCSAVPSLQHSTRRMHHERQSCHIRKRVPALHHQVGAHHQRGGAAPLFLSRAGTRLVFGLMPPASAILSGFLAITSAVGVV